MVYGKTRTRFSIDEILGNTGPDLHKQSPISDLHKQSPISDLHKQDTIDVIKREEDVIGELHLFFFLFFQKL